MQPHNTLIAIAAFTMLSAAATAQTFTSTNDRTSLLELYTSEGCSSCPPADRWVNKLRDNDTLWSEFIPIAFHVDYWDYIGWQDPFADNRYSQRQRLHAKQRNVRSVYTPGIILNGKEWRAWSRAREPKQDKMQAGVLSIDVSQGKITADYAPLNQSNREQLKQNLTLNIALLGFDQSSEVTAGENGGKNFNHNFVVLAYDSIAMKSTAGDFSISTSLPTNKLSNNATGIATWVSSPDNLAPLQATGGWLE